MQHGIYNRLLGGGGIEMGNHRTYAVTGLLMLLAVACASPTAPAPTAPAPPTAASTLTLTKLSVSYSERVGSYLPLILAADQGIFKKHGPGS